MELLIPQLHGRPGDQAKLRRQKQTLKQRMQPDLNCLVRWLAGEYAGFDRLPAAMQALAATVADAAIWSVGEWDELNQGWSTCL